MARISNLHTWGWITVILGAIEIIAGFSLFSNAFGRAVGIFAASLGSRPHPLTSFAFSDARPLDLPERSGRG